MHQTRAPVSLVIGAVAMAEHFAIGAYAHANIALGNTTKGMVNIFKESGSGDILIKLPAEKEVVIDAIRSVYPNIKEFILNFFLMFL